MTNPMWTVGAYVAPALGVSAVGKRPIVRTRCVKMQVVRRRTAWTGFTMERRVTWTVADLARVADRMRAAKRPPIVGGSGAKTSAVYQAATMMFSMGTKRTPIAAGAVAPVRWIACAEKTRTAAVSVASTLNAHRLVWMAFKIRMRAMRIVAAGANPVCWASFARDRRTAPPHVAKALDALCPRPAWMVLKTVEKVMWIAGGPASHALTGTAAPRRRIVSHGCAGAVPACRRDAMTVFEIAMKAMWTAGAFCVSHVALRACAGLERIAEADVASMANVRRLAPMESAMALKETSTVVANAPYVVQTATNALGMEIVIRTTASRTSAPRRRAVMAV